MARASYGKLHRCDVRGASAASSATARCSAVEYAHNRSAAGQTATSRANGKLRSFKFARQLTDGVQRWLLGFLVVPSKAVGGRAIKTYMSAGCWTSTNKMR